MLTAPLRSFGQHVGATIAKAVTTRFLSTQLPKGRIVVALGGNALLRRGEDATVENQRKNIAECMSSMKNIVKENTTTIVHGNGPQVGLLLLESAAYEKQTGLRQISLDVLDAETEGMIGYMIELELQSYLAKDRGLVTVLSQIECDPNDPAFSNPTKFVGPIYTKEESEQLGYTVKQDGEHFRRVVPSPLPMKMVDHQFLAIQRLTDSNCVVICAGGGGIPVVRDPNTGKYKGIEAVIDKDRAAAMVGSALNAQGLLILTDVTAVAKDFGKPSQQWIKSASPSALKKLTGHFPAGSMGPKVESAIDFVEKSGGWAAIGSLNEAEEIMAGEAGTVVYSDKPDDFIEYYE